MHAKNFVWIFYGVLALALLLIALFNCIVDPYGIYRLVAVEGFNQQKEGVRSKIRFVKALELPLRNPSTIIIGSSRVHDGMNPSSDGLKTYPPVYNLGIDMARIHETMLFIKHALLNSEVKRVILGLDLFMFNSYEKVNQSFDQKLIGRKINIFDYIGVPLLTKEALLDSFKTIKSSRAQPERNEFLSNGYRPGKHVFYKVKSYQALHYYTNWTFLTSTSQATKYYASMELDDEVFSDFEEILTICKQQKIDCRLYINPAHIGLDGEGIWAAKKWGMFEEWKRRITQIAFQYGIPLWDFSGYNSVTTEPVVTPMKYYWDSSHFKEIVGDWILARVMEKPRAETPTDFGRKISPENIEDHLESIRRSRDKFNAENLPQVEKLSKLYKDILSGEPLDPEKIKGMYD